MLFNSFIYLLFFPIVYTLYWSMRGVYGRRMILLAGSILLYGWWGIEGEGLIGIRWTLHFLSMIGVNYLLVEWMLRSPERKNLIIKLLVVGNLINIGFFKYLSFFWVMLFDLGAISTPRDPGSSLFLPLAISFYSFQLIAYGVDVYRGVIKESISPSKFFLFILFFPQLIAGPIMRSSDFLDAMDKPQISRRKIYDGSWLFLGGLVKKVVMADPMGDIIAPVFREPSVYSWWSILLAGIGFSIQVYSDFSGYTDMARGSAKLLGYDIPENFSAPYFSRSAREVWQRWHITLSTWLRDYIYFPLGGNRLGKWRTYINLIVTFTLGGFWHGADYTYIAWGGMWGALLALERFIENDLHIKTVPEKNRGLIIAKVVFMFFIFTLGAIMFRSNPVHTPEYSRSSSQIMGEMLGGLFTNTEQKFKADLKQESIQPDVVESLFGPEIFELKQIGQLDTLLAMFIGLLFFHWLQYAPHHFERLRKHDPWLLILSSAIICGFLLPITITGAHKFIYFVF